MKTADQQSELIAITLHSGAACCSGDATHENDHRLGCTRCFFIAPEPQCNSTQNGGQCRLRLD
jgi:hypothetical protein